MTNPFDNMSKKQLKAARKQGKANNPFQGQNKPKVQMTTTTFTAPVSQQVRMNATQPKIQTKGGRTILTHRELLNGNISVINGFGLQVAQNINPGLQALAPWCATGAILFEKYRYRYARFVYVTRAPTSLAGSVSMAVDYNAGDLQPDSEQTMSTYFGYKEGPVWEKQLVLNVDVKKDGNPWRYNRYANVPTGQDVKTYDLGTFYLFTNDGPSSTSTNCGKVYFEYSVELDIPQLPSSGAPLQLPAAVVASTTLSAGSIYGNTASQTVYGTFNQVAGLIGNATLYLPENPGDYLLNVEVTGTGLATGNPTVTPLGGVAQPTVAVAAPWAVNAAGTIGQVTYNVTIPLNWVIGTAMSIALAGATTVTQSVTRLTNYNPTYP
jgi:hypothetical protein